MQPLPARVSCSLKPGMRRNVHLWSLHLSVLRVQLVGINWKGENSLKSLSKAWIYSLLQELWVGEEQFPLFWGMLDPRVEVGKGMEVEENPGGVHGRGKNSE